MGLPLKIAFTEFKEWILPLFAQKFSPKGTNFIHPNNFQVFGDRMLDEYDYTPEREKFLISQTKLYIKICLDRTKSHNTSTEFLGQLLNKIVAYFLNYVMNKYPAPENKKKKNELRLRVQTELKQALFDDNGYIIALKKRQEAKREFRQKTKYERTKSKQEQQRKEASDAYRRSQQIKGMFNDAQNTPRKKR